MRQHGINPGPDCPLLSARVADFLSIGELALPSAHTILLIVADATEVPTDVIYRVAERLLSAGLIYVCVWGPDCERVHDTFDSAHVGDGSVEPTFTLMSTWHDDQPLDEALWFFINVAFPLDDEIETTSYLAVTVGHPD